jgi:hypothetical protein
MKTFQPSLKSGIPNRRHRGFAAQEVVLAAAVVLTFTMGLYYLGEKSFSRLYHFISTMIGSPYL